MIRVLIVDDDKLARKGLISIMPWAAYEMEVVGEAANGARALEFLAQNRVDLMFVDLAMPVISGIDLIEEASRLYPDLKFVVLTFHENFEYVQTTLRLGVLDYISKIQLEKENFDQLFERIHRKMTGKFHYEVASRVYIDPVIRQEAENNRDILTEEAFAPLEKEWKLLHWLYDETKFERLCTQMLHVSVSSHRITAFLVQIAALVESAAYVAPEDYSGINSAKLATGFLRKYREEVYARIAQTNQLQVTPICILKAILYIRQQIAAPLHTEVVAGYVKMSRSYFCQCFKRLVGLTFNSYLRQERMRIARMLLCQTNQTVSWIAQTVGYDDIKYFSHLFHEQTNLLPSEFRKQFQAVGK
jgi:two-component system response regulator YesN